MGLNYALHQSPHVHAAGVAIITSEIDFFKKVNDKYGHHVGDLAIKDFTARAAQLLRLPDILARFGGEEFVILLPDTGMAEARNVAERIRREIETHRNRGLIGTHGRVHGRWLERSVGKWYKPRYIPW